VGRPAPWRRPEPVAGARALDEAGASRQQWAHLVERRAASPGSRRPHRSHRQRAHESREARLLRCRPAEACVGSVPSTEPGCLSRIGEAGRHGVFPGLSGSASHTASHGLIWPKDGFASIASAATASGNFLPLAQAPFLARQESCRPPSSAALRLASECVVDRLRPADRHRGRDGRDPVDRQETSSWRPSAPSPSRATP